MSISPRETLRGYSQKEIGFGDAMRALTRHRDWLVPIPWLASRGIRNVQGTTLFGQHYRYPADQIWVFTDREAAERAVAKGAQLGPYATGWDGVDLFGALEPEKLASIEVNPGSPPEEGFFVAKGGFEVVKLWSRATAVERALESLDLEGMGWLEDPFSAHATLITIAHYDGFVVLADAQQRLIGSPASGGVPATGFLFTARDAAEIFLKRIGPNAESQFQILSAPGHRILGALKSSGYDILYVNTYGPACTLTIAGLADAVAVIVS